MQKNNQMETQKSLEDLRFISEVDYPHDLYDLYNEATSGNFKITKTVIPEKTSLMHYDQEIGMCRSVFLTDYRTVQLTENNGIVWMSDTPMEYETNKKAIEMANGDVLECGLGLGLFTYYASKKKHIKSITIIEKQNDIVNLVYPLVSNKKTKVINSDVKKYLKQTRDKFDMIHVDIWASILPYKEYQPIIRLAKKRLKKDGKIVCWLDDTWEKIKSNLKNGARDSIGFGVGISPCITCGKTIRHDFGGFCMDCADGLGISEIYMDSRRKK